MKTRGLALGLIILTSACGTASDGTHFSSVKEAPATKIQDQTLSEAAAELRTADNIKIHGVYGWIDLMPGYGFVGGPHTRMQVKFKAPSRGCTVASDFMATLKNVGPKQVLTIRRMREDTCGYEEQAADFTLNVAGTYHPSAPILVNGVEMPVMERIIY